MEYRKIWENINGPIPKDEDGRSYEIHHIDGNSKNNNIENLLCVSIREHLDIHIKQKDWRAASLISDRIGEKFSGYSLSEETKKKMSVARKGKKLSEDHKKKLSDAKLGKKRAPYKSGIKKPKVSEALKGRKISEETKKKMSESQKGKIPWNAGKKWQSSLKGKPWSEARRLAQKNKNK